MHGFRPLPLLRNAHLQTLLGQILKGPPFRFPSQERLVQLPDGDLLVLHDSVPPSWKLGKPVVVLVHGLGGSHRSYHLQRLAGALWPLGFRTVRMDLRGCGRGFTLSRQSYNAACSGDVRAALAQVHHWAPTSPITLVGFSLGGNIALKLAGEATDWPVPGLERVAALAPPVDMPRCADMLAQPQNRVYEQHFVRDLVRLVQRRQRLLPDLPRVRFPRRMTMRLFDELYTAPRGGFVDALDYYRRASALPLLERIAVQTVILTARDDPFIAADAYQGLNLPAQVELNIVAHGGHLGFLGWDGAGGIRWAERRLTEWIVRNGS